MSKLPIDILYQNIRELIIAARMKVVKHADLTMVQTYSEIGKMIVEDEQDGKKQAKYGKRILEDLGEKLTKEFRRGFSYRNLYSMRKFHLTHKDRILQKSSAKFKV